MKKLVALFLAIILSAGFALAEEIDLDSTSMDLSPLEYIETIAIQSINMDNLTLRYVTHEDECYNVYVDIGTEYGSSSHSFISGLCSYTLSICEASLQRDEINKIHVACFAQVRDKYGNLNEWLVFNIWIPRETFTLINYEYMYDKVIEDPDAVLDLAEMKSIFKAFQNYKYE